MGRKLDIENLTEEEQKRILEVIQRDFELRKKEDDRIGNLNKMVILKATSPIIEAEPESHCALCGEPFLWLFRPKVECSNCHVFICKNKHSCGMYDTIVDKNFCIKCQNEREVRAMSVKWFYDQLKTKFRRHGGAKIVRELYKKKRTSSQETDAAPEKPPRSNQDKNGAQEIPIINISQHHSESENEELDAEAENAQEHNHADMREQMEEAIAAILLPKLEELKQTQNQANQQQNNKDAVKLAEEILERFLQQGKILLPDHDVNDDDAMMWRYVKEHRENIMKTIIRKISTESLQSDSSMTSLRNAETMTDDNFSDSEMDSMRSESIRSYGSRKAPLTDRIRSLSPDSLRSSLAQGELHGMVQGVILQKDQLIARAEVGAAVSEMIDENSTQTDGQEFSTELKFTAVGVHESFSPIGSRRNSSSTSECSDINEGNWIKRTTNGSLSKSTANTYIPYKVVRSAYDETMTSSDDDADSDQEVDEEEVCPVHQKNDLSELSRKNGSGQTAEVGEILAKEINQETTVNYAQQRTDTPVQEDEVVPIDAKAAFKKILPISNAMAAFKGSGHRNSDDSAYMSEGSLEQHKHHKIYEESDTMSSCSSMDGSLRSTTSKQRSSLLMPAKYTAVFNPPANKAKSRLKSDEVIFDDDDEFGDRLSDAISKQELKKKDDSSSDDESKDNVMEQEKYLSSGSSDEEEEKEFKKAGLEQELEQRQSRDNSTPVKQQSIDVTSDAKFTHVIDLNESIITQQTNEETESEHSDTSSATSNSSMENEETLDDVREPSRNLNGTAELDGSYGSSIQEIVQNLKDAGLQVSQGRYKRSSLNTSLTEPTKKWKVKEVEKPNKRYSAPEFPADPNKLYGFTVDPANYKEIQTTSRDISLTSLLKSDMAGQEDFQTTNNTSIDGETLNEESVSNKNIDEISIPSVSERRSLFSNANTSSQTSSKSSFVEEEIGQTVSQRRSKFSDNNESSSASSSGSDEVKTKSEIDEPEKESRDNVEEKIPTVAERRQAYVIKASANDVSKESGVTSPSLNRSSSDDDASMTSQPVPLKRAVITSQIADDVISPGANHDSGSDASSIVSSATGKVGYEADLSSVTSDPEYSSPTRKPRSNQVPKVVIFENDVIQEDVATPVNQSPVVPTNKEISLLDFERDSPFRGSITMRSGRISVDNNQKYHHSDDDEQTTDDDVTRKRSPRRTPFVIEL